MEFSYALDKALNEFGISGKWLASESGVSETVISRIRTGSSNPTTKTLEALLNALPDEVRSRYWNLLANSSIQPTQYDLHIQVGQLPDSQKADLILNIFDTDLFTPEQQAQLLLKLSKKISNNLRQKSLARS